MSFNCKNKRKLEHIVQKVKKSKQNNLQQMEMFSKTKTKKFLKCFSRKKIDLIDGNILKCIAMFINKGLLMFFEVLQYRKNYG